MNNILKEKNKLFIVIAILLIVIIAIIAGIALTQKPTVANNDNTETENVMDTMTMAEDSTQNDTTESEDVSDTEDSETEEEETDSQTPSSEEDEKDDTDDKSDETDDKKDDESDDKKDEETDDTDDGKDDEDDSEEQEEPADSEEESEDEEDEHHLSESEKRVIAAGYGNVVQLDATTYAVLTHVDGCVNGIDGFDILYNYLQSLDLEWGSAGGCYIDADKDWYWYIAYDVHERIDESDEEFWD